MASEESTKLALKSRKIKQIKMNDCLENVESLLGSLEECAIEEAELGYRSKTGPEVIDNFLKSQEKNLKKLTIKTDLNMPNNLKDLRLEYLEIHNYRDGIFLEFLRHQTDLKNLKLCSARFSNQDLSMICELKQLEALELHGRAVENSGLNKIYQLRKLKKLAVNPNVSINILDQLKFGVLENLEKLDAWFEDTSVESIQEMKRITPNLKKLVIQHAPSDAINALLETLKSLESLKICCEKWEIWSGKVHPNITHLEIDVFGSKFTAAQFTQQFPNLEFLKIEPSSCFEPTEAFFITLLSGLKWLKTLEMDLLSDTKFNSDFVLPCFEKYGNHLDTVHVVALDDRNPLQSLYGAIGFRIDKEPNKDFFFEQIFDELDYYLDSD
jgi:hypothetical protein